MKGIQTFKGSWPWPWIRPYRHTVVHHSSTSTYIPNFIQIEETFCGRTDVRTYVRTDGHFSPYIIRSTFGNRPNKIKYKYLINLTRKSRNNNQYNGICCSSLGPISVSPSVWLSLNGLTYRQTFSRDLVSGHHSSFFSSPNDITKFQGNPLSELNTRAGRILQ